MSNMVTSLCRPLRVSAAQKSVVMCLADRADDAGAAWPSIPGICEWTCLSRTAVIAAMGQLAASGALLIERVSGKNNRCTLVLPFITAACADQCATRTRAVDEPVRETDYTRAADAPEASISINQASDKHVDAVPPVGKTKKSKAPKNTAAIPDDVPPEWMPLAPWRGFVEMRAAAKKRLTVNAQLLLIARLGRMRDDGHDIAQALEDATIGCWSGVYLPKTSGGQRVRSPALHADEQFRGAV